MSRATEVLSSIQELSSVDEEKVYHSSKSDPITHMGASVSLRLFQDTVDPGSGYGQYAVPLVAKLKIGANEYVFTDHPTGGKQLSKLASMCAAFAKAVPAAKKKSAAQNKKEQAAGKQ